jgi:hypothetical protein
VAYATVNELAAALRVRVTTENTPGLQACLDAAAVEINHDIDLPYADLLPAAAWFYSDLTAAGDPGIGYLRLDDHSPGAAGECYLDPVDADGRDWTTVLQGLASGDLLWLTDSAGRWAQFTLTGPAAAQAGWFRLPISQSDASSSPLDLLTDTLLTVELQEPGSPAAGDLALANRVNILRAVEWWKANDAAFGVIGFDETGALQAPRDGFNRHAYTLTPLKRQWGVA